jgi:hypothetical protein
MTTNHSMTSVQDGQKKGVSTMPNFYRLPDIPRRAIDLKLMFAYVPQLDSAPSVFCVVGCSGSYQVDGQSIAREDGDTFAYHHQEVFSGQEMVCELPGGVEVVIRKQPIRDGEAPGEEWMR